ncbi:MAG: hypothetical protein HFI05_12445 [Lachnospiraceae bacterium]|nr:hypothetical protein [Lachnospiraceae bacterium]
MFEQDYIMRLIKEMLRTILKLLFHMDIDSPTEDLLKNEEKESWKRLLDMIHRGNINEAENLVYEMTSNGDMSNLKIALLFYSCLNDKDDNFLMEHGFEREEIKFGIESLVSRYGLTGMTDIFLEDI